ncbi:universal stress protein [Isoptericola variabilis]|uniref:UspA domain-containing protein n=1 Tax=Isoptericola variabilis (strain 225) TaxID=743718 RepID=F6FTN8_ISOV2|nr:universal stress protein [Isoptericola variabilis]AEG44165.1 UspA domain-containing protein [Isoptericola variabilis 225]TWH28520.1 nucleotide-binding universal stress UspA family protein [Isoptericola variabilis J7]
MSATGDLPTTRRSTAGPVVVGYDASEAAETALAWAGREARTRGTALQVVYVRDAHDTGLAVRPGGREDAPDAGAWPVVEEAAARVRDIVPGVETETFVEYASPGAALVAMSRGASLVAVGSTPHRALVEELRGSVALQLAAHAHCPVGIVPALPDVRLPAERPVVVGYDGSPSAARALLHAADAAWFGALALRVVVAWSPGPAEWVESFALATLPRDATEEAAERTLADGLERVRAHGEAQGRRPGSLMVEGVVQEGRAVDVLHREATDADRLVVGTRGRGGFAALLLGSVSHTMIRTAPCPVVVVRDEGAPE